MPRLSRTGVLTEPIALCAYFLLTIRERCFLGSQLGRPWHLLIGFSLVLSWEPRVERGWGGGISPGPAHRTLGRPLLGPSPCPLTPSTPRAPEAAYVLVVHVLQQPELAVSALGEDLRLEGPAQFLDGHLLPGPLVDGRAAGSQAGEGEGRRQEPKLGIPPAPT